MTTLEVGLIAFALVGFALLILHEISWEVRRDRGPYVPPEHDRLAETEWRSRKDAALLQS